MKALILWFLCLPPALAGAAPSIPLQKDADPPALLSQTGIFEGEVAALKPAPGFRSYDIIQPLFVDYAQKRRTFYLPPGTHIAVQPDGSYRFPVGTVLVKHFRMETAKGVFQNLETRVLVRKEGEDQQNFVGYTYKWDGADAELVDAKSSPEVDLTIADGAPGGARQQRSKIPSRRQCLQCHNSSVGFVRSLETAQLNRLVGPSNQLEQMNREGVFDHDLGDVKALEHYAALGDESEALENRVKSYVSVNCSHCHNPDPVAMCSFTGLDFRYASFNAEALVASGHLVKGAHADSEIYKRMASTEAGYRMPFIGAARRDEAALDVMARYVDSLK